MKKTIIILLLALVALTGWAQKFTISGDLSVMTNKFDIPAKANIVYLWNDSLKGTPIEYAVKDGKFEISGNVSRPIYSKLMVQLEIEVEGRKDTTTEGIPFILEPGNIKMDREWALLKGTPLNDASIAMCIKLSELAKAGEKEKLKQEAFNFVKQHAADPASIFVIVQAPNFMEAKDILTMIDMCSEDMQHTNIDFSLLREKVTLEAHAPQEGDKFADFAVEYEGKTTRVVRYLTSSRPTTNSRIVVCRFSASPLGTNQRTRRKPSQKRLSPTLRSSTHRRLPQMSMVSAASQKSFSSPPMAPSSHEACVETKLK